MSARGGSLPQYDKGQARLGYIYASPLVQVSTPNGRKVRMELLDTSTEVAMIQEQLKKTKHQIHFRSAVATPSNLRELLNDGCRMLHYTGHGSKEFLGFESDDDQSCGIMEPLKVDRLKALFQAGGIKKGGVKTELVFISSCSSEPSGVAFVEAGVPHVVAVKVQERVTDDKARKFGKAFYSALVIGRYTVKHSFDIASATVNATGSDQVDNFLLLPRDGNHDVQIFDTPDGNFTDETVEPPPMVSCPRPRRFFLGNEALQRVVEVLVDSLSTCVTITGEPGSGKTEMAKQACLYVCERRRFDSIYYANWRKATPTAPPLSPPSGTGRNPNAIHQDPCQLIGMAVGMPAPGPSAFEELSRYLFRDVDGRGAPAKVLLVLDGVDSLYEGKGFEARDNLVVLLGNLFCSVERNLRLKVLLTCEQNLLRETNARFQNGSERVLPIAPLRNTDPAQLLLDLIPRRIKLKELNNVQVGAPHTDILKALESHPVLVASEGHPGTLQQLAPYLNTLYLNDAKLEDLAAQFRDDSRAKSVLPRRQRRALSNASLSSNGVGRANAPAGGPGGPAVAGWGGGGGGMGFSGLDHSASVDTAFPNGSFPMGLMPTTPTPTPTPMTAGVSVDANWRLGQSSHGGLGLGPSTGGGGGHFLLAGGGMTGGSVHGQTAPLTFPTLSPNGGPSRRRLSVQQQAAAQHALDGPPDAPRMDAVERDAWDTAVDAGLHERGCLIVWVTAAAAAASAGDEIGGRGAAPQPQPDRVPWKHLLAGLTQHLCGALAVPSTNQNVGEGPYGWIEAGVGGMGEGGGYSSINNIPPIRGLNSSEASFVRGVLRSKQEAVRIAGGGRRRGSIGSGGVPNSTWMGNGWANGDGGDEDDMIAVAAFVKFSEWWAPLMSTLSHLRNDWAALDPVRVHGFVGRLEAERQLLRQQVGTFMLRFSESKPGALVISFTEAVRQAPGAERRGSVELRPRSPTLCVQHCLVGVSKGGKCTLDVNDGGLEEVSSFKDLHDLLLSCAKIHTLYPGVAKDVAFEEGAPDVSLLRPNTSRQSATDAPPMLRRFFAGNGAGGGWGGELEVMDGDTSGSGLPFDGDME